MLFIAFVVLLNAALINSQSCKILSRTLSTAQINDTVNEHNRLRAKVANGQQPGQPSASNMKKLDWDSNLAASAQQWADQCKFEHNIATHPNYSWVGQNLYIQIGGTSLDMITLVQSWYNEVTNPGFDSRNINPFKFDPLSSHYTQVVWANTEKVGCGLIAYQKGSTATNFYVVCNYGPG